MASPSHSPLPGTGWCHLDPQGSLANADTAVWPPPSGPCSTCHTCACTSGHTPVRFDGAAVKVAQYHVHHRRVEKGVKTSPAPHSHLPDGETEAPRGKEACQGHKALFLPPEVWLSQGGAEVLQQCPEGLGADHSFPGEVIQGVALILYFR